MDGALGIASLLALLFAIVILGSYFMKQRVYKKIENDVVKVTEDRDDTPIIDWSRLLEINDECVAWLTVDETTISYPVVCPASGKQRDWYLSHDLYGRVNSCGTPYLDQRTDSDGQHLLVFAHHMALGKNLLFGPVRLSYEQDVFDSLGSAHWYEPNSETEFKPLCSLMVDMGCQDIQVFEWSDTATMRVWLAGMLSLSSARVADAEQLASCASRVLTLSTCSSPVSGQRWRTLTIFVEVEG